MKKIFTLAAAGVLAATTLGAQAQTIDGTRDASYPASLAVQTNPTGFGDNGAGMKGGANGDELDNISAKIVGANLYLFIGGNLQTNNNHLEIFFDSKAGGQNTLVASNNTTLTPVDTLAGLKFDAGFNADYLLSVSAKGTSKDAATASFASLNVYFGVVGANTGSYIGTGTVPATTTPLTFGSNTGAVALDNSNTAGVSSSAVGTPDAVSTGLELMIPLAALGSSANGGDIKICAFTNGAKHDFVSNQVLAGLPNGTGNLGGEGTGKYTGGATPVAKVDFTAFAGNQYVTVANGGPLATATAQERAQISVAPNPAQGRLMVHLPASVADLHLSLYNNLGQVVRQVSPSAGATSVAIEANDLASGVYLLRTMSGADALSTQRVVLK